MIAAEPGTPWSELAEQLVELVQAQQKALDEGDVERFAQMVAERGPVQDALILDASRATLLEDREALAHLLEQVAAIDRASFVAARRLMTVVAGELSQVRKGRSALHGYGQNGAGASTLLFDHLG